MNTNSTLTASAIHQTVLNEFRSRGRMLRDRYSGAPLTSEDVTRALAEVEHQIHEAGVNCRRRLARRLRALEGRSLAVGEQVELVEALKFAAARARSNANYELSMAAGLSRPNTVRTAARSRLSLARAT